MAKIGFILQGIRQNNDHERALIDLMALPGIESILLGVAYVRESGVKRIHNRLKEHADKVSVFVGIRNGVTSAQGLLQLLVAGVKLYVVDTGSPGIIFHPKIYLANGRNYARIISGSANLTFSGLNENIEASTIIHLDLSLQDDRDYLSSLRSAFQILVKDFPQHVILLRSKKHIIRLLSEGRVEDERIPRPRKVGVSQSRGARQRLERIRLHVKNRRPPSFMRPAARPTIRRGLSAEWVLQWVSKGLTERDLNIPSGRTTNRTGSMLFKKGETEGIDQRHYFRQTVFGNLIWAHDISPNKRHLERAEASFEIIIKGVSYGIHLLRLTHNTKTNVRAYEQKNSMTQIHWGTALNIVAQRDLLNRQMRLYQKPGTQEFVLQID